MDELMLKNQRLEELPQLSRQILEFVGECRVLAFYGELGAGKTTLIRSLCSELGVTDSVTSPTFSLVHSYEGADVPVHHFDLYRLSAEEQAEEIGWYDYVDGESWVFIEWPERISSLLPEERVDLVLETDFSGDAREIHLKKYSLAGKNLGI